MPTTNDNNKLANNASLVETDSSQANSTTASTISNQRQLLSLAHQFGIDGAISAAEQSIPIFERASRREQQLKVRQQKNLENILHKAVAYSSNEKVTDKIDVDWFFQFTELASSVSNSIMQSLWAKILAGEVEKPGAFSLKALHIFKQLSMHDAKLFAKACSLSAKNTQSSTRRIITGCYQPPALKNFFNNTKQLIKLGDFGLNYTNILTLANNNLLFKQEAELSVLRAENLVLDYQNQPLTFSFKKANGVLTFIKFTAIGNELAQLIEPNPQPAYHAILLQTCNHLFDVK